MACLREVTFFPDRPERRLPCFISRMLLSTFCPAFLPYFLLERLRDPAFLRDDFLPDEVFFLAELLRVAMMTPLSLVTDCAPPFHVVCQARQRFGQPSLGLGAFTVSGLLIGGLLMRCDGLGRR